ncbi:hypothetical protein C8A00DRAFT_40108 [Chaetomidium leptoderma]|uniref:Uncharacterized protein n=1 Tax=Chaetomidium leptoderma TaxID=669021 RepID=A0AAN6VTJ7_9PEZI|nr:hypothetical protein C8A00DRAFT_40108 [Chaetomidium leptoderma]
MTSTTPIPVALFGNDPKIARAVCEKLLPDFEVVHVCLTLSTALTELPALFSLTSTSPSSSSSLTSPSSSSSNNTTTTTTTTTTAQIPTPASGLGTNANPTNRARHRTTTTKTPQAVFFGGNFSDDEYHAIVDAVKQVTGQGGQGQGGQDQQTEKEKEKEQGEQGQGVVVQFIKVQKRDVLAAGSFGPSADAIAKVFRRKMAAALEKQQS